MEANYHEESTNSSEEVVDQENNDLGVGRSYECVFCKRGFNTAQALGGHMNIHRKDRARNKPNSTKQDDGPRLYRQIPSSRRLSPHLPYATYFPAASSNSTLYGSNYHHQDDSDRDPPQPSNHPVMIIPDWRMRLSLVEDVEKNRSLAMINQDKELDLELRLGYD